MSRFVDTVIAYRILNMLVTPFEDTEAFKLGIIDKNGKELKLMRDLNSVDERDAYTVLHRMVYRIKKIIQKVPIENKKLVSFAAALSLIKENYPCKVEPIDLEYQFLQKLDTQDTTHIQEDIQFIQNFLDNKVILPFRYFFEDAPANNAVATPGIDGFTPETIGVKKKKKILKRDEVNYVPSVTKAVQKI